MNLSEPSAIKGLFSTYQIRPRHNTGQNFLIDQNALRQVVNAADLAPRDTVLEVGPGLGVLTVELAKRVKRVIAVELDQKLINALGDILAKRNITNVEIIHANILKLPNSKFQIPDSRFKVVSNLPYQITGHFLKMLFENEPRPELSVLMLQQEVAERIVAKPGHLNILALSVQFFAEPEIIAHVPKTSFWPIPKVDSAIVRIRTIPLTHKRAALEKDFFRIIKIGFSSPRKTLANNISSGLKTPRREIETHLQTLNLKPTVRAQELSLDEWLLLARIATKKGD